ncbi:DUF2306 domain-containing protein [Alteribacter natronophilus]|uniref:DUF2306 domain-containing protein n=1 Tax=Alteribacter natronophilus TaxID=2583810 RepID=UPI00110D3BF4|nr:DUF2306 domain-containing protein [Alteribacter natronophilus]TMW71047.1 DUF2306 domain-containing protein [Alteribacter natronophilus]
MFDFMLMVHIAAGTICLISGLMAMSFRKKRGRHSVSGEIYHGAYIVIFLTSTLMAVWNWSGSAYLFYIGIFSYALALTGYLAGKRRQKGWIGTHIGGMLGSYIAVITAIIVVNVHKVPMLGDVPILVFWLLPTVIGSPAIYAVGRKYRRKRQPKQPIAS